jgi:hypothetical protein
MKIPGITLPDVPDAGVIDGDEMILVFEENNLKAKQLSKALERTAPLSLFQSGIPFVIFAGDGGSNGLSFSGTRGVFTLSAAVLTNFWNILSAGGYAYIPAGAGGLSAGWYWCVMTGDTAGEIFSETYTVGSGNPAFIASPTTLPNCTAGYITQPAAEVVAVSFALPGGSVGPNGILRGMVAQRTNNSAGAKIFRLKIGTTSLQTASATTSNCDVDWEFVRQNAGVQTTQIGNRNSSGWLGSSSTTYSGDKTALDLSVDQTITFTISRDTVTDSALGILREFTVKYGA